MNDWRSPVEPPRRRISRDEFWIAWLYGMSAGVVMMAMVAIFVMTRCM